MKTFMMKIWNWFLIIFAIIPEKQSKDFDFGKHDDFMRGPKN